MHEKISLLKHVVNPFEIHHKAGGTHAHYEWGGKGGRRQCVAAFASFSLKKDLID